MIWDWDFAFESLPVVLSGLPTTVIATVLGSLLAYVLGLVFAVLRRSPVKAISRTTYWVVEFIRTTPLIVQLFFLFFVLPNFGIQFDALTTGIVGLGVHYAAYTSEVYRAGIEAVPHGQWEACRALSLPPGRVWTSVILPQAIPKVVPALGNYTISMFKETPLLFAITVTEMLTEARGIGDIEARYLEPYTIVGLMFLLLSIVASLLVQLLERYLAKQHV